MLCKRFQVFIHLIALCREAYFCSANTISLMSKRLVIHADDLGMSHSVNVATFAALESGAVTSASVMVPCPWFPEVAVWARAHPDADIGVHLTFNSEWKNYRWGPVSPRHLVSSLLDSCGYFFLTTEELVKSAKIEEVEHEARAQIELMSKMALPPTHIDLHMFSLMTRLDCSKLLLRLSHEYHIPLLVVPQTQPGFSDLLPFLLPSDITIDQLVIFHPGLNNFKLIESDWVNSYVNVVNSLKPGLTEILVHLGEDDAELKAITAGFPDFGASWRANDVKAVTSSLFKAALKENNISLVTWRKLNPWIC